MLNLRDALQQQNKNIKINNIKSQNITEQTCQCRNGDYKCKININYSRDELLSCEAINTIRKSYLYDGNIQDLFANIAIKYGHNCHHRQKMYNYISLLIFIPSTPIIRTVNKIDNFPISCFSNTLNYHHIEECLDKFKEVCLQLYGGGGCAINLSNIGHHISKHNDCNIDNYIHAIEALHEFTRKQVPRKSAICYYLNISHPEIFKFMEIRKPTFNSQKISISAKTHIAVIVNPGFMKAVQENAEWNLINPTDNKIVKSISARELWLHLIKCRYETGEPFIYFEENVELYKPEVYKKLGVKIGASNLCTEIFIPCDKDHKQQNRNGVCCLGSINVDTFWDMPEEEKYTIIKDCLLFLDNVLNVYTQRLGEGKEYKSTVYSINASRAVGLGIMGWHTYLINRMIAFDSNEAEHHNKKIFNFFKQSIDKASIELGQELGDCQDNKDANLLGRFTLKAAIAPNSHISNLAGVSPGINPIISNYYQIKTSGINTIYINKKLISIIEQRYQSHKSEILSMMLKNGGSIQDIPYIDENIRNIFKTAYEISQEKHIEICAQRNKILTGEQGQSINIYLHKKMQLGQIMKLHMLAYKEGIKTLYYAHNSPEIQASNDSDICLSCI